MSISFPQSTEEEIYYPSSDGKPVAETDLHLEDLIYLLHALEDEFPETYVAADMFWYWEKGNPRACRAPDVMFIPGVGPGPRRSFFSWRENGIVPSVIFELSSEQTWREDLEEKAPLYAQLGVKEYFLFDPDDLYLQPQLIGFRLQDEEYVRLEVDEQGRLYSEELAMYLKPEGYLLRLFDGKTGNPILSRQERSEQESQRAEQESQRAEQESQRANALEDEVARLRALLKDQQASDGNDQDG